ncbi:ParA family protein [Fuerstiella marisgermanici]|uniref:Sporulation initiation inhibitor protein soj n=1 Tax=Fuerstiella marisgermanici TaxID=1891926 RepID=A0A1P8WQN6_9PLAN|nr:ParA family protein [Fuerstiella marisgermanici]APZ96376.1 Sporulation initiation inhibitor protein soj [Fuerstiella marisgermanici]
MPTTICVINQKGGCGKSTTCFHLAGALASAGRRTLLLDVDPQGSLSQGFLGSVAVETLPADETMAALFGENRNYRSATQLIRASGFENISLVPANQHLAAFNTPYPEQLGLRQFALREFLSTATDFDVVLIDCPPNLYRCSWSALLAADEVVIPVPPEDFGTQGLVAVHQTIRWAQQLNPELRLLGHLVTRRDQRLLIHRMYEDRIRLLYPDTVLKSVLPEAAAFKVSLAGRTPVEFDQPRSVAAQMTRLLADELLACSAREMDGQTMHTGGLMR